MGDLAGPELTPNSTSEPARTESFLPRSSRHAVAPSLWIGGLGNRAIRFLNLVSQVRFLPGAPTLVDVVR